MNLIALVQKHTIITESDEGTANMVFLKIGLLEPSETLVEELKAAMAMHVHAFGDQAVDLLDGKEHNYIEIGGWIGDQTLALQLMGLGNLLGMWRLLTPITVLGLPAEDPLVQNMAGMGMVAIQAVTEAVLAPEEEVQPEATPATPA